MNETPLELLALCCNLHGEGPRTLNRLRRAGYRSLAEVVQADAQALERALSWSTESAERFLREAAALSRRNEAELIEPVPGAAAAPGTGSDGPAGAGNLSEAARLEVLGRWRELDREEPPSDVLQPRPGPRAARGSAGISIRSAPFPGLGETDRERLVEIGVTTLEELGRAPTLELSRALGIGYARVVRLQFLARRA